jgi:IS1 family transposase
MNRLRTAQRAAVVKALVDGNSIRATVRLTGVAKNTVTKLLVELGAACAEYQDKTLVNLPCKRVQADEIWAYIGAKERAIRKDPSVKERNKDAGDVWTWTAIDADTKLIVSYAVGPRNLPMAIDFMKDVRSRLANRVQLTTDAYRLYLTAVDEAFSVDVDYAQLHKVFANEGRGKYSPPECIGCTPKAVAGDPDPKHISTSYVERQNLSMRMSMRRFTRLTNGFSRKLENHMAAVSLYFLFYNFARVHQTLRVTPAMAVGIADHVWSVEEIVALLP